MTTLDRGCHIIGNAEEELIVPRQGRSAKFVTTSLPGGEEIDTAVGFP